MRRHNRSGRLRFLRVTCLSIGIVEAIGALLWSLVGAGMYGSPLRLLIHEGCFKEVSFIISIILIGPGVALWAGLSTGKLPCRSAMMFFFGAALSLILGARYQDMGLLLAALIFLPMCIAGLFSLLVCRADAQETTNSRSSDSATTKPRLVQFSLLHFVLFIAALCTVIGLSFAHAEAARDRPLNRTPFLENLRNHQFVSAFTPLEPGAGLISRLRNTGGFSGGDNNNAQMLSENFTLDLPRAQPLPVEQQIEQLRKEFEDQLISDGAQILKTTTLTGKSDQSIDGAIELRIDYRWGRTRGTLEARRKRPDLLQVDIEESSIQSFLRLQW